MIANNSRTNEVSVLLLTSREAAAALAISEKKLWSITAPRGELPAVRIGRSVRYSLTALQAWIEDQQIGVAPNRNKSHSKEVANNGRK
jgi:excisionase family DNA binding protein